MESYEKKENLILSLIDHMETELDYPKDCSMKQFDLLLKSYRQCPETLTLDALRELVADHLQNVLVELKDQTTAS